MSSPKTLSFLSVLRVTEFCKQGSGKRLCSERASHFLAGDVTRERNVTRELSEVALQLQNIKQDTKHLLLVPCLLHPGGSPRVLGENPQAHSRCTHLHVSGCGLMRHPDGGGREKQFCFAVLLCAAWGRVPVSCAWKEPSVRGWWEAGRGEG